MNVTQMKIAGKAKVSVATVSKALRGSPEISNSTRTRILKTAGNLGYDINEAGYKNNKNAEKYRVQNQVVAVISCGSPEGSHHEAYLQYLEGMGETAEQYNLSVMVYHVAIEDTSRLINPENWPNVLKNNNLAGVILVFRWPQDVVEVLNRNHRCVSLLHDYPECNIDTVSVNYRQGYRILVKSFIECGRKKIGFCGYCSVSWGRLQYYSFREALAYYGLEESDKMRIDFDTKMVDDAERDKIEFAKIVDSKIVDKVEEGIKNGYNAWACVSNTAAYSLAIQLKERGYKVPDDVSLCGFLDCFQPLDEKVSISCINVCSKRMGKEAIRMLFRNDISDNTMHELRLECVLFQGGSIG